MSTIYTSTHLEKPRTPEQHRIEIERLRRERDEKVAEQKRLGERQRAEWTTRTRQAREIDIQRQLTADAVSVERRRQAIAYRQHLGLPLDVEDQLFVAMDERENTGAEATHPDVIRLREWALRTAKAHGIDVRESRLPQAQNGSAVRLLKRIDTPPVQSFETAATVAHEIGHCLSDAEPPNAPSKAGEFGLGRICVAAELLAWQWVLEHVPVWNHAMHGSMCRAIETYRKHATADEVSQIDELISKRTYADTKLRIACAR